MNVRSHNDIVADDTPSYRRDVLAQPQSLSNLLDAAADLVEVVDQARVVGRPRVVLAGMGSSHEATFPLWRALTRAGIPTWRIEAAALLDEMPAMAPPGTLLWLTSQSGESAEVVALLDRLPSGVDVVGVTNTEDSTLARAADHVIDLHAGPEATVSTKSYLNTIAAIRLVVAHLFGAEGMTAARERLSRTVTGLAAYLERLDEHVDQLGSYAADRTLLMTGRDEAVTSALVSGLILKESAKVPAEGMSAGSLRHGVVELAGPGLAVTFFDRPGMPHSALNQRLAHDLAEHGTQIGWVGGPGPTGSVDLPAPAGADMDPLVAEALAFQTLSFALARHNGVTPGAFNVARKVTDTL